MTSTATASSRSFSGEVEIEGQIVPVAIIFADGMIRMSVGPETIGTWPVAEVAFEEGETGYHFQADGDRIRFEPHQRDDFAAYLATGNQPPRADTPASTHRAPMSTHPTPSRPEPEAEPFRTGTSPAGSSPELPSAAPPDAALDPPGPRQAETGREVELPLEELGMNRGHRSLPYLDARPSGLDLEPDDAGTDDTTTEIEPSLLAWDEPASHDDPGNEPIVGRSPLRTPLTQTPPTGSPPEPSVPEAPRVHEPEAPFVEEPHASLEISETRMESGPATLPPDTEAHRTPPGLPTEAPASGDPHQPPDLDEPVELADPIRPPGKPATRNMASLISRLTPRPDGTAKVEAETEDDTPQPMDDQDNIRQWLLVVAGGVVVLAVMAMIIWSLAAMMSDDDGPTLDEPIPTTVAAVASPEPVEEDTPTTTEAPPTSVSPENREAAQAFVSDWNAVAAQYAYHLSISAETLPISTTAAPTVHLTYDDTGLLQLSLAPQGDGNDRDVLVAMGIAVAWADPQLSPQGRRDILGELGIDVDNPDLAGVGGETERNGIVYSAELADRVLRFEVARSS